MMCGWTGINFPTCDHVNVLMVPRFVRKIKTGVVETPLVVACHIVKLHDRCAIK